MINIKVREAFFDRPAVIKAIGKARVKALSRAGAFVMTGARRSIRRSPNYSKPGRPPTTRKGSRFKNTILFRYDKATRSVVVGPTKLNAKGDVPKDGVPAILERGGTHTTRRVRYVPAKGGGVTRLGKPKLHRVPAGASMRYEARPFMGPALRREIAAGKIPAAFKNSVRGP